MQKNHKPKPIETRKELIEALKDVAELEHQFMCMYLYAAFSLKKNKDESCNEAQLEAVRRWASKIYMIARQEMEHLSVVNSMLAAIGAPPHFSRQNISAQSPHLKADKMRLRYGLEQGTKLKPCDFPFIFEPFDLCSAKRYTCMESPELCKLSGDQEKKIKKWCFQNNSDKCPCLPESVDTKNVPLHRSYHLGTKKGEAPPNGVEVGTVQELYQRLRQGFEDVAKKDPLLFVGRYDQHQVEILSEYDIYIFPVTDLTSALNGIDLIVKQGEGINAPPDFDSHFHNFFDIAEEYVQVESNKFVPALPVPSNPKPDIEIKNEFTKKVFDLFNYSYVTLLYVLTGLYGWYKPASEETSYPHLSAVLREIAFAPIMTMLIRSLGEVLVQLPLDEDYHKVAAPTFYISDQDDKNLQINAQDNWQLDPQYGFYTDIEFYLERFDKIIKDIEDLKKQCHEFNESTILQLDYIFQNVYRLTGNLRQIYQTGVYSKFRTES